MNQVDIQIKVVFLFTFVDIILSLHRLCHSTSNTVEPRSNRPALNLIPLKTYIDSCSLQPYSFIFYAGYNRIPSITDKVCCFFRIPLKRDSTVIPTKAKRIVNIFRFKMVPMFLLYQHQLFEVQNLILIGDPVEFHVKT